MTDVLHGRALVSLRTHLRAQRHRTGAPEDPIVVAGHEGRLLALEQVGAITAQEAAHWRRRLHEAATWQEPAREPHSEAVAARAADHLETILAPITSSAREGAAACFSAIAAYGQTGILTAGEALSWRERLRAQLDLEPERPPWCSRHDLVRVVAGPAERRHGLRITSVELYDDGVVLLWHHACEWSDGPETPRVWNYMDIETAGADELDPHALTDDLGTRYSGRGGPDFGINGGGSVVRFGTSVFTPAVPTRARRLHVPLWDGRNGIDIDL
jgi:hypothetical protein